MRSQTRTELVARAAEKRLRQRQIREIDVELGALIRKALDEDQYASRSSLGRMLGLSHTAVGNLADRVPPPQSDQIVILDNTAAGDYVAKQGARIRRSISSFGNSDAWARTLLDPRRLVTGDQRLSLPQVFWHLDTGEWVGVTMATVGYGGTGCGYTESALRRAGVDPDVAKEIVRHRFCDAMDIDDPTTWKKSTKRWPFSSLTCPSITNGYLVRRLGRGLQKLDNSPSWLRREEAQVDETGFHPSPVEVPRTTAWLQLLDSADPPKWAAGPRRARLYLSQDAAAADGYITHGDSNFGPPPFVCPQVVIEQGDLQIWGHFTESHDDRGLAPVEAYEFLEEAGFDTSDLQEADARRHSVTSRAIRALLNADTPTPPFLDLTDEPLHHSPTTPTR